MCRILLVIFMLEKNKKSIKLTIINSILIFGLAFITHNLYKWLPSFATVIFPVNESLYEHAKMIFITPIIYAPFLYLYMHLKKERFNNYCLCLFITVLANLVIFYAIYLPIYYLIGEKMVVTLIIYFITILISQFINVKLLYNTKKNTLLNVLGIISLLIMFIVSLYLTYNPIKISFFFDPLNKVYGIYK